ncbi:MAG: rRNA pseudouridine synthase, partial [Candidatus Kaiserbacteria bacterium]|nr:rRNA pseudouridine synthase [Candidatus Kaiserbacteria bacterium]
MEETYPMRINKYLAARKYCTRREADEWITEGRVMINGRRAVLGDKVRESDQVDVRFRPQKFCYFAYNKPRGVITHSAQGDEKEIADAIPLKGVFPVGRLDKDSFGLIILTDDGRVTDALLNPAHEHEKEYQVLTLTKLPAHFKERMEAPVDIGGYETKRSSVRILGAKKFSIVITEGKKHQIRRMCGAFGQSAVELKRIRIMNIKLG